jgi:TonB family protein
MTTLTAFLASYVVSALWQVPLLYLAGCIVAYVVRRIGPAAEHRVWIAILLLCVLVPAFPAPGTHGQSIAVAITDVHIHRSISETTGPARGWKIPLWIPLYVMQGIVGFWLLTVAYAALRLLVGVLRTRRMVATAQPYTLQPNEAQLWQRCVTRFGLSNTVVLETGTIQSPVTVSQAGQDILLLPPQFFSAVPAEDAQAALAHEAAHMRRQDYRNNIALQAAATAIFFHPFTLPLRRQLTSSREMACDAAASAQVGSAYAYRNALLHLATWIAEGNPAPSMTAAIGIFDSHSLEDRLKRLEKEMPNINTVARYALAAVAFLGITVTASALALNSMRLLPAGAQSKTPTSSADAPQSASPTPPGFAPMPRLIYMVDPKYPELARHNGDLGEHACLVRLTVDTDGMPQNLHMQRSCGSGFDDNALAAVRQWRFRPAVEAGQIIARDISVEVKYKAF